jgi:hypothetical protein
MYQFMLFVIQGYATEILKNNKKQMQREKLVKLIEIILNFNNIFEHLKCSLKFV